MFGTSRPGFMSVSGGRRDRREERGSQAGMPSKQENHRICSSYFNLYFKSKPGCYCTAPNVMGGEPESGLPGEKRMLV